MSAARALLASALLQVLLRLTGPLVAGSGAAHVYTESILRQLLLWGLPGLLFCGMPRRRTLRPKPSDGAWALLAGGAGQYLLAQCTQAWQGFTGAVSAQVPLPDDRLTWVLAVLALVIVPAVTEELFFRHGVTRALAEGWSPAGALLAGAAIFAMMHASLAGFPAQLGVGVLLGLCWLGTESLAACILLHGAYNACALWWSVQGVPQHGVLTVLAALAAGLFAAGMLRRMPKGQGTWRAALPVLLAAGAALAVRFI